MKATDREVFSSDNSTSSLPPTLEVLMDLQQHAIAHLPTNIYIYDLVDQYITYASKSVMEILGYASNALEDIEGQNVANLIHGDDLCLFSRHLPSLTLLEPGEFKTLEYRMKGADGTYHWLRSCETTLVQANGGYPLQILGIVQDITSYKTREQIYPALLQSIESLSQMVMVTDSQGAIVYVNRAFEEVTGYTRQEVMGKTPALLKSGHHDTAFYRQLWNTIHAGEVFQGDFVNRKKDDTLFYDSKKITPVTDMRGNITHFVSLTQIAIA